VRDRTPNGTHQPRSQRGHAQRGHAHQHAQRGHAQRGHAQRGHARRAPRSRTPRGAAADRQVSLPIGPVHGRTAPPGARVLGLHHLAADAVELGRADERVHLNVCATRHLAKDEKSLWHGRQLREVAGPERQLATVGTPRGKAGLGELVGRLFDCKFDQACSSFDQVFRTHEVFFSRTDFFRANTSTQAMLDLAALWTDTGHADTGGWSPAPAPKGMLATDVSVRHEPDIGASGSEPVVFSHTPQGPCLCRPR
jgi:hypothetical protein